MRNPEQPTPRPSTARQRPASKVTSPPPRSDIQEHTAFLQEALLMFGGARVVEHTWKPGVLAHSKKIA